MLKKTRLFLAVIFIVIVFSGCQTADEYRKERVKKADEAFKKLQERELPPGQMLTLPECISIALENNLDIRVYDLKAAVNSEQKTAAMLGMLPNLTVNDSLTKRNNNPESVAVNTETGKTSDIAFYSQQQHQNVINVDLAFSVIDFGLAYFNSVQAQDRIFITDEERRRAAQNLVLDVTSAYFTVAAAQYEMEKLEKLIVQCDVTDQDMEEIKKNRSIPVFQALYYQQQILELKRDLRDYKRFYDRSWIQLNSLMGYHPISEVKVDISVIERMPDITLPDIEMLENIALIERPELYQLDIQRHVTIVEARKTILMMFPNVQAFQDFTGSSNIYLVNRTWWEIGLRASYNLLKLPEKIAQYRATDKQADQIEAQALALSVGILAQVRIAYADLYDVRERFLLQDRIWKVYAENLNEAEKAYRVSGGISDIQLKKVRMQEGKARLERSLELMRYYTSYYRVLNSIGVSTLDKEKLEELKKRLEEFGQSVIIDGKDKLAEYKDTINSLEAEEKELIDEKENLEKLIAQNNNDSQELTISKNLLTDEMNEALISLGGDEKIREEVNENYSARINPLGSLIEELAYEKKNLLSSLDKINKELADIASQKKETEGNISKLENSLTGMDTTIKKYDDFILKLENLQKLAPESVSDLTDSNKNISSGIPDAQDPESRLNTQMQLQVPGNTIYEEGYTPRSVQDYYIQTQEEANNNTIGTAEFNNTPSGSLNNQMIWDTERNLISSQEMNP